jgi:hypothetical protein
MLKPVLDSGKQPYTDSLPVLTGFGFTLGGRTEERNRFSDGENGNILGRPLLAFDRRGVLAFFSSLLAAD